MVFESGCYEQTRKIGAQIAQKLHKGDVVALGGELGAGKTALTAGVAAYFGFAEGTSSPTFTIINQYDTPQVTLYHLDVYRLSPDEADEIGLEEILYGDGIVLIEWAEKIRPLLPPETIWVTIEREDEKGPDARRILVDWGSRS